MEFLAFENELKGYWASMKAALQQGNLAGALECISSNDRSHNETELSAIMQAGSKRNDEVFRDLKLYERHEKRLLFLRRVPGGWIEVHFEVDFDGVWRITRF